MGITTEIAWCDSTLNLMMGCQGCELWNPAAGVKHCYAGNMTARWAGKKGWPESFNQPKLFPERLQAALRWSDLTGTKRLEKPWLDGYPRLVFLNDLGDPFTESLDLMCMAPHIHPMANSPHVWIMLTKRPGRMGAFWWHIQRERGWSIPRNFWLMTSITGPGQGQRIEDLLLISGAAVRGLSLEPLLGPVDLPPDVLGFERCGGGHRTRTGRIDWVIVGGESGPGARPMHPQWARDIRDQCLSAGVGYFHKQNGEWRPMEPGEDGAGVLVDGSKDCGYYCDEEVGHVDHRTIPMIRVGKRAAGRLLDGREWSELPEVRR